MKLVNQILIVTLCGVALSATSFVGGCVAGRAAGYAQAQRELADAQAARVEQAQREQVQHEADRVRRLVPLNPDNAPMPRPTDGPPPVPKY